MIRKQIKRHPPTARAKRGTWAVFGLHGGKEGKAWQKGKFIVRTTNNNIRAMANAQIIGATEKIEKLRISDSDKNRLIRSLHM